MDKELMMGTLPKIFREGIVKDITFCVTEDCNLVCRYCYITGKNSKNKMTFETAKKAVDFLLSLPVYEKSVVFDFIGGEPLLEIELIDKISDYLKLQMYLLNHPWFDDYMFSIATNGISYDNREVQNYISKNQRHISIGISVDGNKIKHDLQRIWPDGSGSYDDVVKNVPLWLTQFPNASTKATFSHDDLPYLKDSIISLWDLGIKHVMANVVFEDVWEDGDDIIFEEQLIKLADYIVENNLWYDRTVRFFDHTIGFPLSEELKKRNFCGAGRMLAINYEGKLFPCVRFINYALNNRKELSVGDIENGFNYDKLRPFLGLSMESQSPKKCLDCEVASGCSWCTGNNYDVSETGTIYQRAVFNCKMHKANVRANEYLWKRYSEVTNKISPREKLRQTIAVNNKSNFNKKKLIILTNDKLTPYCNYENWYKTENIMNDEVLELGLKYSMENDLIPVVISNNKLQLINHKYTGMIILSNNNSIVSKIEDNGCDLDIFVINIDKTAINKIYDYVKENQPMCKRIVISLIDIEHWNSDDIKKYEKQLDLLNNFIIDLKMRSVFFELNILTDLLMLSSMNNCNAGINSYLLAPNGNFYICPAFYFDNPSDTIGNLYDGLNIKNEYLLKLENSYICSKCDAYHCKRCLFINKKLTGEINTPPKIQCIISHTERKYSKYLQEKLTKENIECFENHIEDINYMDPAELLFDKPEGGIIYHE